MFQQPWNGLVNLSAHIVLVKQKHSLLERSRLVSLNLSDMLCQDSLTSSDFTDGKVFLRQVQTCLDI